MKRRDMLFVAGLLPLAAVAHHGWSSFDQDTPLYLEGRVKSVRWANPHAEIVLDVPAKLALPADLDKRTLPAQSQAVDGAAILKKLRVPDNAAGAWTVEFAPLFRMEAWGLTEPLKAGDSIAVIGYAAPRLQGGRVFRVEYLFARGGVYGLRSSPSK